MKKIILLLYLILPLFASSQTVPVWRNIQSISGDYIKRDYADSVPNLKLLSSSAFDRFISTNYSFALLGSTAPATGIKVETDKPSITLKGNIFSSNERRLISTIELTAGLDNSLMQVFSNNKLNGVFKAGVGLNFLLGQNWANYPRQHAGTLFHSYNKMIQKYDSFKAYSDTARVLEALLSKELHQTKKDEAVAKLRDLLHFHEHEGNVKELDKKYNEYDADYQRLKNEYQAISAKLTLPGSKKKKLFNAQKQAHLQMSEADLNKRKIDARRNILKGQEKNDLLIVDTILNELKFTSSSQSLEENLGIFNELWASFDSETDTKDRILAKYKKYGALTKGAIDSLFAFEMGTVSDIWTRRSTRWLNLSPFLSNTNFTHYDPLLTVLEEKSSFLFGLKFSYNQLLKWKEPHRFMYWSVGAIVQRVNTLDEMDKFDYKRISEIKAPDPNKPQDVETITDEKGGTAYKGIFDKGLGVEIPAELYCVPWKHAYLPGLYGKAQFKYGNPWIDPWKIAVSFGLLWNVTNGDKESKNLLSIVPYARFSNIFREHKDFAHQQKKAHHDLFSVGVQVGIPINLGK